MDRQVYERTNNDVYTIYRQQSVHSTQTIMWSQWNSRKEENTNVVLQEHSLDCLCRTIKGQDKENDE